MLKDLIALVATGFLQLNNPSLTSMSTQLSAEWERRIEFEAQAITAKLKENNDYQTGYCRGVEDGYDKGATIYVTLLVEAQERIKTLEDGLKRIQRYCFGSTNMFLTDINGYANEALSPDNKLKEDE